MPVNGAWWAVGYAGLLALFAARASSGGSRDAVDPAGRQIPERYLPKEPRARARRVADVYAHREAYRRGDPRAFAPFPTDEGVGTRTSTYVKLAHARGLSGDPDNAAKAASGLYGAPVSAAVLRTAYERGLAAWASGGHRPGASASQWAAARVASLLVGGKTAWTADRDLFARLPASVRRAIVNRAPEVVEALRRDGRTADANAVKAATEAAWRA